jgi:hypothetical protein
MSSVLVDIRWDIERHDTTRQEAKRASHMGHRRVSFHDEPLAIVTASG